MNEEIKKEAPKEKLDIKKLFPSPEELNHEDQQEETPQSTPENEYSGPEQEAIREGWLPKEQFKGDPNLWVSAPEFIRRGKLIDRIGSQHKEIENMRKANEELVNLVKKQAEKLSQEKATEILAKKREAIAQGDVNSAEYYEKEYNTYQNELHSYQAPKNNDKDLPREYRDFADRNATWLNPNSAENNAMMVYADKLDQELARDNPSLSVQDRLDEVESRVKDLFPHRFDDSRAKRAPAVEGKKLSPKRDPNKITFNDLPEDIKKVVNNMVKADRSGKLTRDEYAQQLLISGAVTIEK
uniref:Uncharacterized protein n=1 Tax=viral metagenome TaxID=1070528 RepID=A0A6M3J1E4_9ZZZZ